MTLRSHSAGALLTIGEVGRRTGKAASTIRYYEEIGLISPPERISGRRRFPTEIVRELAIIETAQRAGLSLEEIHLLLQASPQRRSTERLREVAERKLPELNEAIARAHVVRGWLEAAPSAVAPLSTTVPSSTSRRGYQNPPPAGKVRSRRDHRRASPQRRPGAPAASNTAPMRASARAMSYDDSPDQRRRRRLPREAR
jgi:MerR family transcriptional regulator, redox-sensitive transcriptional activator SoxR